jgi:hypothetical protein
MATYTADQLSLKAHIDKENADFRTMVEAEGGTVCMTTTDDIAHWAAYDIFTIDAYEHYMASAEHTDCYKDLNGIKPRWMDYDNMTTKEIHQETLGLYGEAKEQIRFREEQDAEDKLEDQARKDANAYKPNLVFAGLADLIKAA